MNKNIIITIIAIALIIILGTITYLFLLVSDQPKLLLNENVNQSANNNLNQASNNNLNQPLHILPTNIGLANPASVKCGADGGVSEAVERLGGADAICVFQDESICNEWDYFRGDCQQGDCFKSCEKIGTTSEGWYDSCSNELINYEKCDSTTVDQIEQDIEAQQEANIIVTSPQSNQQLSSPFKIEGQARVFENEVKIRFKSKDGRVLIEESTMAKSADSGQYGDFSIEIGYEFTLTTEGYIEVYSLSAKDGSEENLVSIPVKF